VHVEELSYKEVPCQMEGTSNGIFYMGEREDTTTPQFDAS
jgi:hypothetical protein